MSDYACVCDAGEADGCWEWCSKRLVKAAREYKCSECQDSIVKGEKHEYLVGKFDGEIWQYRTCLFCAGEYDRICRAGHLPVKGDLACWLQMEYREEI